ncbi:MAG: flagellar export chaperone FliS [Pseudomonadota bacterium]
MSPYQKNQYQAYSSAIRTVAKTRQVVMLYDTAIKFLKQTGIAISEQLIEDRFNLSKKASEIMIGLQSSIDFDNGGEIANILHDFYTNITRRIIALNYNKDKSESERECNDLIEELKQMREVWENIDSNYGSAVKNDIAPSNDSLDISASENISVGIALSV